MCFKPNNEKIEKILEGLEALDKANKQTLEEFLQYYSKKVDKLIINTQLQEKTVYQTGKITLSLIDNDYVQCHLELYFQNTDGKYIKKELSGSRIMMYEYLCNEAISKMRESKTMSFDVYPPEVE